MLSYYNLDLEVFAKVCVIGSYGCLSPVMLCHVVSREPLRPASPLYPIVPCAFRLRLRTAPPFPAHPKSWRRDSASSRHGSRRRAKQLQRPPSAAGVRGRVVRNCQGSGGRGGPRAPQPYATASLLRSCDRPEEGAHRAAAKAQEGEWGCASGQGRSLEAVHRDCTRWRSLENSGLRVSVLTPVSWVHHIPHSAGIRGARPAESLNAR